MRENQYIAASYIRNFILGNKNIGDEYNSEGAVYIGQG